MAQLRTCPRLWRREPRFPRIRFKDLLDSSAAKQPTFGCSGGRYAPPLNRGVSSLWTSSREARIESFSSRFVLGEFIDTMESLVEFDTCEPGRKGSILASREFVHRLSGGTEE